MPRFPLRRTAAAVLALTAAGVVRGAAHPAPQFIRQSAAVSALPGPAIDPTALSQLVDSVMRVGMADEHIPGAAVLVLDRGRVVLERGYGVADVATRRPVDPRTTRWPFASITKVVTATAVMRLVEQGRVRLDGDVNRYLTQARVPACACGPITPRQLLTHTDGLDELPGRRAESRGAVQPLGRFLSTRLVRAAPPGGITRYGSYGIALAGVLVEDVSGVPYPEYLRREIFSPLGMRQTTVGLPPGQEESVATPYEWADGSLRAIPYEWYHTTPTSSLVGTVDDLARFVALHLGDPPAVGVARVLRPATIRDMAAQHATVHRQVPGWGYGWQRSDTNGQHVVEHGGDIGGFSSLVVLLPDAGFGLVVVHHLEGSDLRFKLRQAILDRFFPDRRPIARPAAAPADPGAFAGIWLANNYCRSCAGGARAAQRFEITAQPGGSLRLWDQTWHAVGPLLFADASGRRRIGFQRDRGGAVVAVSAGAWRVLERAPPGLDGAGGR